MRGSAWGRWDLHVHTPASFEQNYKFLDEEEKVAYGNNIWEKYVSELEKIENVSVLGITDYFSIDGYKKIVNYREKGRLSNFDLILPNIELRLDELDRNNKKINYHVIFSDEVSTNLIEREFINRFEIKDYDHNKVSLCRENIENIGKSLKKDKPEFGGSDFHAGCTYISVDLDDIINLLKKPFFQGKNIKVLVESGWDTLGWNDQSFATKKELLHQSDAMFSSNEKTIKWLTGESDVPPEDFERLFNSLKPAIHGSDAHSFDRLCKPDLDRYCWIKADATFEGLKQIIYEPAERVKIGKKPEIWKNLYSLNFVEISNSDISEDLQIEPMEIPFNRNLVVVTGGKGSGKTALLDLIANCFEDRCKRSRKDKDDNSFVKRIQSKKEDLTVKIGFFGEDIEDFSKELIEEKFFEDSKINYLPQGEIDEYSSNQELLNSKIEDIIFNNEIIVENGCKEHFELLKEDINKLVKNIDKINREIYELEQDTSESVIEDLKKRMRIKDGEYENKDNEILTFKKDISKDMSSKIEKLKEEEINLRTKHSKLENLIKDLALLKKEVLNYHDSFNTSFNSFNEELKELEIKTFLKSINVDSTCRFINESLELLNKEIAKTIIEIRDKKENLEKVSSNEKQQAKLIEELEKIKSERVELKSISDDLHQKMEEINILESKRLVKYQTLLNKYLELEKYYKEVIETFSEDKLDILGEIDFKSSISFDKDQFIEVGNDILHSRKLDKCLRKMDKSDSEEIANNFDSLLFNDVDKKDLKSFIRELTKLKDSLKDKRDSYDFYKWIFGNYFSLNTNILFDNRPMDSLSMGQKGTVLLKLFLSEGDYPLIIDQPEDNLDNKFIYKELVGAFKYAKKNRQIIIATNNANLVVNADAEQIIIAESHNKKIKYKLGSLENEEIRDNIVPILEGGEKAFKEREEKYGI